MKRLLLGAAVALALSAGGASASTWLDLTQDTCTGTCGHPSVSYGTVQIDGLGTTSVSFDVELASDVYFNQAGHPEEAFSFDGGPAITISSITPTTVFGAGGAQNAAANGEGGTFGNFDYVLKWVGPPTNNGDLPSTSGFQSLKFTVTSTSVLNLLDGQIQHGHNPATGSGIFFVVDLYGSNGKTGKVGAVMGNGPPPSAPEPATWGLMLAGFGGLGAMLRRRRASALA